MTKKIKIIIHKECPICKKSVEARVVFAKSWKKFYCTECSNLIDEESRDT